MRGRARLVLDKIKQFEDVFDRDSRTVSGVANRTAAGQASGSSDKTSPVTSSLADPRYDAQGVLKPVVSRKKRQADRPLCTRRCRRPADLFRIAFPGTESYAATRTSRLASMAAAVFSKS